MSQFADDLAIYIKSDFVNDNLPILENYIRTLDSNLSDIGLGISSAKSKLIKFSRNSYSNEVEIDIRGHSVKESDRVRFLGIIFDPRLSF